MTVAGITGNCRVAAIAGQLIWPLLLRLQPESRLCGGQLGRHFHWANRTALLIGSEAQMHLGSDSGSVGGARKRALTRL